MLELKDVELLGPKEGPDGYEYWHVSFSAGDVYPVMVLRKGEDLVTMIRSFFLMLAEGPPKRQHLKLT
jgi:hypothetical protein